MTRALKKRNNCKRCNHLAETESISLQQIIGALTDKDKVLNFPIGLPPIELGKQTTATIYAAAAILALGAITTALIIRKK